MRKSEIEKQYFISHRTYSSNNDFTIRFKVNFEFSSLCPKEHVLLFVSCDFVFSFVPKAEVVL